MTERPEYLAGCDAFASGLRHEDCPHEAGSQAEDEWLSGFFDSENDSDGL